MELFDSHCHLNDEKFNEDREEVIKEIVEFGMKGFINAGYSIESSKEALNLAEKHNFIYATAGISPNDVPNKQEDISKCINKIEELLLNEKIVAIGEIGLDYYWNKENKDIQKEIFIKQIELANIYNLPIVIHTREAVLDTIQILKENEVKNKGVFHCCPLNRELVKEALKLGFYISFAGPITFKNSKNADEIINMVPNDKFLIETDSPYLSPEPNRGKRNDPRNVIYNAQKIANVKNISVEDVAKMSYDNVCNLFKI